MQLAAVRAELQPAGTLRLYYDTLLAKLGPQGWWPARTRLEVILGAILVQNTSWNNAALAIKRLRDAGLLNLGRLRNASAAQLEACVRPAGFYRQKAAAIRSFLDWLHESCNGSLARLFARAAGEVRQDLLGLRGFGPETVDAILLYAGRQPIFVADAYTRRILSRHSLVPHAARYAPVQEFLHRHLPVDSTLFNEYHALLVETGKRYCKRQEPNCAACPLAEFLPRATSADGDGSRLSARREGAARAKFSVPSVARSFTPSTQKASVVSVFNLFAAPGDIDMPSGKKRRLRNSRNPQAFSVGQDSASRRRVGAGRMNAKS